MQRVDQHRGTTSPCCLVLQTRSAVANRHQPGRSAQSPSLRAQPNRSGLICPFGCVQARSRDRHGPWSRRATPTLDEAPTIVAVRALGNPGRVGTTMNRYAPRTPLIDLAVSRAVRPGTCDSTRSMPDTPPSPETEATPRMPRKPDTESPPCVGLNPTPASSSTAREWPQTRSGIRPPVDQSVGQTSPASSCPRHVVCWLPNPVDVRTDVKPPAVTFDTRHRRRIST